MADRPLIGVSTYLESGARWGVWELEAALFAGRISAAGAAGGRSGRDAPAGRAGARRGDRRPRRRGGDRGRPGRGAGALRRRARPAHRPPARARDTWELALIEAALAARVPLLGICRGMQLLNVALGGTLVQHIEGHAEVVGVFGGHPVRPVPGTLYAGAVPEETFVPTYHHQAVDRLGSGLVASAHAADGTVEALEMPSGSGWVLGVQWHPEMGEDVRVMRALVAAARSGRPVTEDRPGPGR